MVSEAWIRTAMLLGEEGVERLCRVHVAVFGIGGVGGHAMEALVRSGVGEMTLVDNDTVAESNLNRQIIATRSTVGMRKTDAAALRVRDINPDCVLHLRPEFVLPETVPTFPIADYDYVIDAIDTVSAKLALIKACHAANVPIISAMGAGNKLDPTRFEVTDIYKTHTCPLAAVIRRELRKAEIPHLKVVFSPEEVIPPAFQPDNSDSEEGAHRRAVPSSSAFVPAVSGLIIAGEVVRDLTGHGRKTTG